MMSGMPLETRWIFNNFGIINSITSCILLVFLLSLLAHVSLSHFTHCSCHPITTAVLSNLFCFLWLLSYCTDLPCCYISIFYAWLSNYLRRTIGQELLSWMLVDNKVLQNICQLVSVRARTLAKFWRSPSGSVTCPELKNEGWWNSVEGVNFSCDKYHTSVVFRSTLTF